MTRVISGIVSVLVNQQHEHRNEPKIAAAHVASSGERLTTADLAVSDVSFKTCDGRWLPIDTPTAQIAKPSGMHPRLGRLLAQARAIRAELAPLEPAIRRPSA